jgi:hypothetical protein
MGKQMQAFLVICSALLPLLVLPAGFKCNLDTLDASAGTFCCRDSRDFGISSCDGYTNPRRMILELDLPVINGKYGLLVADEDIQHNGNRVSLRRTLVLNICASLLAYVLCIASLFNIHLSLVQFFRYYYTIQCFPAKDLPSPNKSLLHPYWVYWFSVPLSTSMH